jgi:hypothetical protein
MFEEEDLTFDQRTLEGLGNLYNSLVSCPHSLSDLAMVYPKYTGVKEN